MLNIAAATQCILEHDLFHQMGFAREMLHRHAVPMADSFAYTPTVPVVHYEWGAGLIGYAVLTVGGWDGAMVWTLVIAAAALGIAVWASRRLGAHAGIIGLVGLVFVPLMARGYPPVRAQAYSYIFFLSLIAGIEAAASTAT